MQWSVYVPEDEITILCFVVFALTLEGALERARRLAVDLEYPAEYFRNVLAVVSDRDMYAVPVGYTVTKDVYLEH